MDDDYWCRCWLYAYRGGNGTAEETFVDLKYSKWAEDGITYMAKRGTVAGYGNGNFKPEALVTRAQAVTFMVRELYSDQLQRAVEGTTYSDVPTTHPFHREIMIGAKNGLASGFPNGTFRPDAPLSRAETAAFLTRAYALVEGKNAAKWTDTDRH